MNRRNFNKMLAAAFGSVALGLTPRVNADSGFDILEFCETDDAGRYDLTQPFIQSGHKIATDGRILIRIPSVFDSGGGNGLTVPNLDEFDWAAFDCRGWKPWPTLQVEHYGSCCSSCRQCRGYGLINFRKCDCPGRQWETDPDWCGRCDHEGIVGDTCPLCKGKDCNTDNAAVIGKAHLNQRFDSIIRDLPGVEFLPCAPKIIDRKTPHTGDAIPFRFDGGVGLVMPLNEKRER